MLEAACNQKRRTFDKWNVKEKKQNLSFILIRGVEVTSADLTLAFIEGLTLKGLASGQKGY